MVLNCKQCGIKFKRKRKAVFCSRLCSQSYAKKVYSKPKVIRFCKNCGKEFLWKPRPFRVKMGWGKFCSKSCNSKFNIKNTQPWISNTGKTAHNKGQTYPKNYGSKNHMWRGSKAGHTAKHIWVKRHWGQPDTCEFCKKTGLKGLQIHWSNKDHKYRRVRSDWQRLCSKCHKNYDLENGLSKQ